jgi:hypothetical protein
VKFGGLHQSEIVTGAAAGVTAFVVIKQGLIGKLPAVGPVTQPFMAILVGLAVVAVFDGGGDAGDVARGVAYGFIAAGAAAL